MAGGGSPLLFFSASSLGLGDEGGGGVGRGGTLELAVSRVASHVTGLGGLHHAARDPCSQHPEVSSSSVFFFSCFLFFCINKYLNK